MIYKTRNHLLVYQGGGNLTECIVFGRLAGKNAAEETPLS